MLARIPRRVLRSDVTSQEVMGNKMIKDSPTDNKI